MIAVPTTASAETLLHRPNVLDEMKPHALKMTDIIEVVFTDRSSPNGGSPHMPTLEDRLRQWQQELLDFSNRNRLLNFRWSTSKPSSIELVAPDAISLYRTLVEGKSLTVIGNDPPEDDRGNDDEPEDADLVEEQEHAVDEEILQQVKPGLALSMLPTERTNRVLLRLLARARTSEQEQGINTLFAAFGLLKWQDRVGLESWQHAPLVLLPLTIEERTREGSFRIASAGEDPEFNQTLVERLRRDFKLDFAMELDEETDLADVLEGVRTAVSTKLGWEVLEQVHLGHFQFYKLRMYADLAEHAGLAAEHEIIQALGSSLATIAPLPDDVPSEIDLDRIVLPESSFTVLDADASQLRAIQAVVRRSHLIIQGPPGTGKSQTIANIIAEFIAAGRTVLFVSEKSAAIDVVHRRLKQRGLDEFCLMLHSHKASKREIISELGARLEPISASAQSSQENLIASRLQQQRLDLDEYATSLHRQREPLGESVFWVHGELALLGHVPLLTIQLPNIESMTREEFERAAELFEDLSTYASTLAEGSSHPWHGAKLQPPSLFDQQRLRERLASLIRLLDDLRANSESLANDLQLPVPTTLDELRNIQAIAGLLPNSGTLKKEWFEEGAAQQAISLVSEARSSAAAKREIEAKLSANYEPVFLKIDAQNAIASYEQGFLARLFSSSHKAMRAQVRAATIGGQERSRDENLAAFRDVLVHRRHLAWFHEHEAVIIKLLDLDALHASNIDEFAWDQISGRLLLSAKIQDRLGPISAPPGFLERACQPQARESVSSSLQLLETAIESFDVEMRALAEFFDDDASLIGSSSNLESMQDLLTRRASRLDDLDRWVRAQVILRRVEDAGLRPVLRAMTDRGVAPDNWVDAFERLTLTAWLDRVMQDDPSLNGFSRDRHDTLVEQFASLDHSYLELSNRRVRRAHAEKQGRVTSAYGGEPQVLRFEMQKRKRHMPLRRLFERIPNLLPTLKPCLMMSPLSVAHYLPADLYHFDLVIFDEASQVRPHDAIGAIMRGRQLVVAGDSRQLPPTSFFDRVTDDGEVDEEQDIRALESILDALNGKGMPSMRLLWHYRSRHEDLIAYSNHHFYDSHLITFPSPNASRLPSRGVHFEYVEDGRYEDERDRVLKTPIRVNRIEAKRIAALVMEHARLRREESLGVVTLGMSQRDIVEEEIKQALLLQEDLDEFFQPDKTEPFFVKALEQVQGDERDVIMISMGYGKNAEGVLSHNFGPINQQGGERRLNVLVTRARNQVVLASSIRYSDIDPNRTQNVGPRLLHNYLEFAERGVDALNIIATDTPGEYESPFEEQVGESIRRAGFVVHPQVGSSRFRIDLAIVDPRHPDRYVLGIECDGKTYHQSKTARDRDRLRQEMLEDLGWKIHRIWSTEWIRYPDRELQRVLDRIQELLAGPDDNVTSRDERQEIVEPTHEDMHDHTSPGGPGMVAASLSGEPEQDESPPAEEADQIAVPYETVDFPYPDTELWHTSLPHITDTIIECVEVEGPIHQDLVLRRIASLWGYQRAGSRIARIVNAAILNGIRSGRIRRAGEFLWPAREVSIAPRRGVAAEGTLRDIEHVPDEEIVQAITAILQRAYSLSPDDLVFQASRVFGFQRAGHDIKARILAIARGMYRVGIVEYKGARIQISREYKGTTRVGRPVPLLRAHEV